LKKLRYIAVLFLAFSGLGAKLSATIGTFTGASGSSAAIISDTTEPYSNLSADTSQPAFSNTVAFVAMRDSSEEDGGHVETDPPGGKTVTVDHDDPAGELYEDFDTTLVHSEKFDALAFNDTIQLVFNAPGENKYVHPFDGTVTSKFGFRKSRYHFGYDINLETGDSVKCCFDGKVRIAQRSKSYGFVVVVRHNNGLETYYAHLSKLMVRPGDEITAGTILGLGGNTGHSHGSHLHFEVRFRGQPIDPSCIIDFQKKELRADTYALARGDFKYLTETVKVRHYSRKKKKTWYTYYTPGGAHYATPEARRIMNGTAAPAMASTSPEVPAPAASSAPAPKSPPEKTAAKTKAAPAKTSSSKTGQNKTAPAKTKAVYYSIKKGDTLYSLALKYNTTVDKICKLNGIKSNSKLQIGQKVRVK
jgi:murein DD-endopeptidase MepM/ murein hydrolase activator NlpD/LysM repeat protein